MAIKFCTCFFTLLKFLSVMRTASVSAYTCINMPACIYIYIYIYIYI